MHLPQYIGDIQNTGIRGRFHQYFVHGEALDCAKWKEDYANCLLWRAASNREAFDRIVDNESERIRQRREQASHNDIWRPRVTPPADFAKPLPEHLEARRQRSSLMKLAAKFSPEPSANHQQEEAVAKKRDEPKEKFDENAFLESLTKGASKTEPVH